MTKKQQLIQKLNQLKAAVGEAPVSAKWELRARTWAIESMVAFYEREAANKVAGA